MRNPFRHALAAGAALGVAGLLSACGGDDDNTAGGAPITPVSAQAQCDALGGVALGGAALGQSTLVAASGGVGEYCKVVGTLHDTLNFEIHLPTTWNNKLLYEGGGGWDGAITITPYSPSGSTAGYVVVASDGGRQGSNLDAASFLKNPQGQNDFGYLSIHSVLEVAKEVVQQRYGSDATHSYFEGCSNGGREALIQATRFPNDYDGIVVRAPAYTFTQLFQAFVANGKALNAPGGQISDAKALTIGNAVTAQCDAADGVADGIVSNPEACTFDPSTLRCTGADNDSCLTDPQIDTAKTIYSELKATDGTSLYPGWGPGGEGDAGGWPVWVTGTSVGGTGLQFQFGSGLVKYWVTQDPAFDVLTWNPDLYQPQIQLAASILDATPDLGTFFKQGRKLVLVHGTTDWAISYKGSIKYFNNVATSVGGASVRDESMELYLEPGVQHCAGGSGADTVDLVDSVSKWVENGTRPSAQGLVARKLDATSGATLLSRPMCRYPSFPKYKGTGDVNSSDSYTCQTS